MKLIAGYGLCDTFSIDFDGLRVGSAVLSRFNKLVERDLEACLSVEGLIDLTHPAS